MTIKFTTTSGTTHTFNDVYTVTQTGTHTFEVYQSHYVKSTGRFDHTKTRVVEVTDLVLLEL